MASSAGIAADSEPTMAPSLPVDDENGRQRDDRPTAPPTPTGSGLRRLRGAATNPTNWRVRTKLIAILTVPIVAILAYSSIAAASVLTSTRDVNRVSDLTKISKAAVTLANDLAGERTYTTGYVASGAVGAREGQALPPKQEAVNDAYQAYKATTDGRRGSFGSSVHQALDDVQTRMDALPAKRQALQRLVAPASVEIAFQPIIDSLTNLIRLIPQGNDDQELTDGVNTAYFLMSGTELLSEEQALVFSLIAEGSNRNFLDSDYQAFLSAETQRTRDRDDLENFAGPKQIAIFNPTVDPDDQDIQNTNDDIKQVLSSPRGEPLPKTLTPEKWNRATQETIDTSIDATGKLLDLVDNRVDTLRGDIQRRALLAGLLVVLILAAALVAALIVARSLVRPLLALRTAALDIADRRLPEAVRRLRDSTDQNIDDSIEPVGIDTDEEVGELARAFDGVHREAIRLASEQASLRNNVNAMFINLSRRSQGLVERQLRLIDDLENREQDPDQLANLFKLDHLATRMRRNNESLLVLAGTDTARRWTHPVPLNEVVLAAISEVEQYTRVKQTSAAPVSIAGNGVSDVVHLVAELLENATSYSPPVTDVLVTSHSLGPGAGAMIEIEDRGIGMPAKELERVNERLASPPIVDVSVSRTMGLFAVGRLAGRHGIRVQLRESSSGGITAVVRLPAKLVTGDAPGVGRVPAINRPAQPAIAGPAGARDGDRPTIDAGQRTNGLAALAGTGPTNGAGNGQRPGAEPATRGSIFDDKSGPGHLPSTGPFPLTGPLAAQIGSDRTGPLPTTDRRGLGLEAFGGGWTDRDDPGAGADTPADTGPVPLDADLTRQREPQAPDQPAEYDREATELPLPREGTGPKGSGRPGSGVTPATEHIERRGPAARRDRPAPDVTSPMSFGDSRWPTRPRPAEIDQPPVNREESAPRLPVRGRPEPGAERIPTGPQGSVFAPVDRGPVDRGPVDGEQPANPPAATPSPTGPQHGGPPVADTGPRPQTPTGPQRLTGPQQPTGPQEATGPGRRPAEVAAEVAAAEKTGEQPTADAEGDEYETSPIFDSVSAWFQRRSPADEPASAPARPAPAVEPAAAAAPARPAGRSGLGGAFGHRVPARSSGDPLTGPRPLPVREPTVESAPAATPMPTRAPLPQRPAAVASPVTVGPPAAAAQSYQQPAAQPPAPPAAPTAPGEDGWSSPGDAGWRAAEASRRPTTGGTTQSGLPVRVPMTHLVPGSAEPAPRRRPAETPTRSPEAVGGRLASFYQGVRQGRDVGVDTTRNPRRDAQEER